MGEGIGFCFPGRKQCHRCIKSVHEIYKVFTRVKERVGLGGGGWFDDESVVVG